MLTVSAGTEAFFALIGALNIAMEECMQVKVSEDSVFERTLEVILDQNTVNSAYDRAFGKAAKRLALPGFRRGKVPPNMAKKYITDEGLGGDVVEDLVPRAYHDALHKEKLSPISEPKWELVQRSRGQDLIFKVKFEVKPVLKIENYTKMPVKAHDRTVPEEKFQAALEELRAAHSTLEDAEPRPVVAGDFAQVDYSATLDGEPFEGGQAENSLLELKPDSFIPGFIDNIVGLEPGQEKEFDITFPEDYGNKNLAGKQVCFKFTVRQLKEKKLPEVTDEFVKKVSTAQNVEEFHKLLRENLESQAERIARESVSMRLCAKLVDQVALESIPNSLVAWKTNIEIRRRLQELSRMGVQLEQFLQSANTTQEAWVKHMTNFGAQEARLQLLLESIAAAENLEVTAEELDQLFAVEAEQRGMTVNDLKEFVRRENSEESIHYAILSAKVRDFLFDNAEITYVAAGEPLEDAASPVAGESGDAGEAEKAPKGKGKASKAKAEPAPEPKEEAVAAPAEAEEKPKASKAKKAKAEAEPVAAEPEAEEKPKAKRAPKKKAE